MAIDITAKRLQILKEAIPSLTRAALLVNPSDEGLTRHTIERVQSAASSLNITVQIYEAGTPEELDRAFSMIAKDGMHGVLTGYDAMFTNERRRLAALALARNLPMITQSRPGAVVGAFMSYGIDSRLIFRRAGFYIDKILKGSMAGQLPVEQPTKFELLINLQTARTLGITVSPQLLARADEVIE